MIEARPVEVTSYVHSPANEHYNPERLEDTTSSFAKPMAEGA
jgi:hypothetical protein